MPYANSPRVREAGLNKNPNKLLPDAIRTKNTVNRERGTTPYPEGKATTVTIKHEIAISDEILPTANLRMKSNLTRNAAAIPPKNER
jgi:hypothetical protein